MILVRVGLLAGLLAAAPAWAQPQTGAPKPDAPTPLTAQTRKFGGERPADQLALHVEHVDYALKVLVPEKRVEGDATVTLKAERAVPSILLDFYSGFNIARIDVDGRLVEPSRYRNPEGLMTIAQPVAAGRTVKVRVRYAGSPPVSKRPPWEGGTTWTTTPDGQPWIDTAHWGGGCDLMWPCIDHPTRRPATADLRYTVPAPLVAPGNGTLVGMVEKNGWRTYHWRARSPNTYAMVLDVGPYKVLEGDYKSRFGNTIPMRFWYLPGEDAKAAELFKEFPLALDFFESQIGPYPWGDQKMGVVRVPWSGLENQTLNGYSINWTKTMFGFDPLMHHEFSHEWFANHLSAANYDDLWLHEGIGSYMQPLLGEYLNGDADYFALIKQQRAGIRNAQPLVAGRERDEKEVYADPTGPQGDMYPKGSLVMHTLRALIGKEAFYRTIRMAVYGRDDPKPGNFQPQLLTTPDFVRIASAAAGRDLKWFFDVYMYCAALPKLVSTRDKQTLKIRWQTPDDLPFPMPLDVRVDGREVTLPMSDGTGSVPVTERSSVTFDPHSKILMQSDAIDRFQAWRAANEPARR
jgi:aminopeptidase N